MDIEALIACIRYTSLLIADGKIFLRINGVCAAVAIAHQAKIKLYRNSLLIKTQ